MKNRLPAWFKQNIPDDKTFEMIQLLSKFNLHTVCQEAKCPNLSYCFNNLKFTFIILGDVCTRNCQFCAVSKSKTPALNFDNDEPYRISQIVKILNLDYVVITSVTRDDLSDGGAASFAKTIELIHGINQNINIEALIPDFSGNLVSLKTVINANPSILAHNIETVRRLYKELRPMASYKVSLDILSKLKEINPAIITKSSLILGMGEKEAEVIQAMEDLRYSQCDILNLGQYLAPSIEHYPVKDFISIEQFQRYREIALTLGFRGVLSGPRVRSSYKAEEAYEEVGVNKCMT